MNPSSLGEATSLSRSPDSRMSLLRADGAVSLPCRIRADEPEGLMNDEHSQHADEEVVVEATEAFEGVERGDQAVLTRRDCEIGKRIKMRERGM